jgi:hypothetical protein
VGTNSFSTKTTVGEYSDRIRKPPPQIRAMPSAPWLWPVTGRVDFWIGFSE